MAIEQITLDHLLRLYMRDMTFRGEVERKVEQSHAADMFERRAGGLGATHLVFFQNTMLDSTHLGEWTILFAGPGCTYKTVAELEGQHLGDVPSRFMYPQYYVDLADPHAGAPYPKEAWE